ncbi:MAG: hypothetical protein IPO94_08155 [Saprospiraceae bacterium]|nr:hypothetical protein [Saprospiraceae bacterium]
MEKDGVTFLLANAIGSVRDIIMKSGLDKAIPLEQQFTSLADAYKFAQAGLKSS